MTMLKPTTAYLNVISWKEVISPFKDIVLVSMTHDYHTGKLGQQLL